MLKRIVAAVVGPRWQPTPHLGTQHRLALANGLNRSQHSSGSRMTSISIMSDTTKSFVAAEGKRPASRSPSPVANKDGPTVEPEASTSKQADAAARKKQKLDAHFVKRLRKDAADKIRKFGEDPIYHEARELLGASTVEATLADKREFDKKFAVGQQLTVDIKALGAGGSGLAVAPSQDWLLAVPKALPGDKVRIEVLSNERLYSKARVLEYELRSEMHSAEPFCRYFDRCGGCQYQTLPYEEQLKIKARVVENAFKHYSGLDASLLPGVRSTLASPKERAYRTKLTPHFDLPLEVRQYRKSIGLGGRRNKGKGKQAEAVEEGGPLPVKPPTNVPIGFEDMHGKVIDIEECPIGTQTINDALPEHRQRIKDTIYDFPNGATLLLRDSLASFDSADGPSVAVTDHKATVKEMVGAIKFESPAGAFFQNNRSILPDLLAYVRDEILASRATEAAPADSAEPAKHYLVDAYCGSGLFSLCLAHLFHEVAGVELSAESIKCATTNATMNGITNAKFLAGSAENIFGTINFAPQQTTVVIDPPRRGCDDAFIEQLVKLAPRTVVYVSCNVHTQARDVGAILRKDPKYKVLSIRGADLFPQTNHVEGICILQRE